MLVNKLTLGTFIPKKYKFKKILVQQPTNTLVDSSLRIAVKEMKSEEEAKMVAAKAFDLFKQRALENTLKPTYQGRLNIVENEKPFKLGGLKIVADETPTNWSIIGSHDTDKIRPQSGIDRLKKLIYEAKTNLTNLKKQTPEQVREDINRGGGINLVQEAKVNSTMI